MNRHAPRPDRWGLRTLERHTRARLAYRGTCGIKPIPPLGCTDMCASCQSSADGGFLVHDGELGQERSPFGVGCSDVLEGDANKQVDHHLELAAPRPRSFGFFAWCFERRPGGTRFADRAFHSPSRLALTCQMPLRMRMNQPS